MFNNIVGLDLDLDQGRMTPPKRACNFCTAFTESEMLAAKYSKQNPPACPNWTQKEAMNSNS